MSNSYIVNFNVSRDLADIKYEFDIFKKTNINILLEDFVSGSTKWSVTKGARPGDNVVFMCAKTARDNLGLATSHIPASYGKSFIDFVNDQKDLYKKYSGYLLGHGEVSSFPQKNPGDDWWMADIVKLRQFSNPVYIDDFRSFISISRTNSITFLTDEQWERLKWLVNQTNTDFFKNVVAPDIEVLDQEYEDAVKKEQKKSIDQLEKEAKKKASKPSSSSVQTKVYHRDPTIAAKKKKRANGVCQLCGNKAPFNDDNGEPYLECHHIDWISKGGMDSIDNCVALCPNCHRKMHVINDPNDIKQLKEKIKS